MYRKREKPRSIITWLDNATNYRGYLWSEGPHKISEVIYCGSDNYVLKTTKLSTGFAYVGADIDCEL